MFAHMTGTIRFLKIAIAIYFITAANLAAAAKPKALLKNAEHWGAFVVSEKGGNTCYVAGQPRKLLPKGVNRGAVWLLVTHRPYRKITNEISILMGYPLKKKSKVSLNIDGKIFKMFTDSETAWAADKKTDTAIVAAMRAGNKMKVSGLSARGTKTSDSYSLKGFSKAHQSTKKACKVKR